MSLSPQKRTERADLIKFSAFLTIAAVFTVWVAAVTGEIRPGDREPYKAVFDDVSGLTVGDEVRIAGVDVGKVTETSKPTTRSWSPSPSTRGNN